MKTNEQLLIRQYLLGRLSEADRLSFEEKLLTDNNFFAELLIVEDELIDNYLDDQMSKTDSESFRTSFLTTPERVQKLRFAKNLKSYATKHAETFAEQESARESESKPARPFFGGFFSRSPSFSYALAAAAILILTAVSWAVWRNLQGPKPSSKFASVHSIILMPGRTRDNSGVTQATIPAAADALSIRCVLRTNDQRSYRASIQNDAGVEAFAVADLQPDLSGNTRSVTVIVPTELLKSGDYKLTLSGLTSAGTLEDVDSYYFRISKL